MKLVLIPPGEFMMGLSDAQAEKYVKACDAFNLPQWREADEDERPQHKVRLTKPFLLAACEATVGHFRRFVEETAYKTDAERDVQGGYGWIAGQGSQRPGFSWRDMGDFKPPDETPVVNVSWDDAIAFCDWLSKKERRFYRLPTEAEWEFACRAGSESLRFYGEGTFQIVDPELERYSWYGRFGSGRPNVVGAKPANPFGLHDVYGNAAELCNDRYGEQFYKHSPVVYPTGPASGHARVRRGGNFGAGTIHVHSAQRDGAVPPFIYFCGFRAACDVDRSIVDVKSFEETALPSTPPAPPSTPPAAPPPAAVPQLTIPSEAPEPLSDKREAAPAALPIIGIDWPSEIDCTRSAKLIGTRPEFDIRKSWQLSFEFQASNFLNGWHMMFFWGDDRFARDPIHVRMDGAALEAGFDDAVNEKTQVIRVKLSTADVRRWKKLLLTYDAVTVASWHFSLDEKLVGKKGCKFTPLVDRPMPVIIGDVHSREKGKPNGQPFLGRVRSVRLENN